MGEPNERATQPLKCRPIADQREEKPRKPLSTSWFTAPFLWFNWACAWIAYGFSNFALFKVLEYAGKTTVLIGVIIWILGTSQREQTDRRIAWSVVNSKGGGRKAALEHLYRNKVDLRGLYGEGGFFEDIDLHGADLEWANLRNCDFMWANLTDTILVSVHLDGTELSFAHLEGAQLLGAHLEGAILDNAHLNGANLKWAHLNGANLSGADLSGADLIGAKLKGVSALGARLTGAKLNDEFGMFGADLTGAKLTLAQLDGADLTGVNLSGANLWGADLSRANLRLANLRGAHLEGANLTKAKGLIQQQIDAAHGIEGVIVTSGEPFTMNTTLPAGIVAPKSWTLKPPKMAR